MKNKLLQICILFSRMDFFWKKECTGCTRLMRKGIQTEKNEKDDAGYFLKVSIYEYISEYTGKFLNS